MKKTICAVELAQMVFYILCIPIRHIVIELPT